MLTCSSEEHVKYNGSECLAFIKLTAIYQIKTVGEWGVKRFMRDQNVFQKSKLIE